MGSISTNRNIIFFLIWYQDEAVHRLSIINKQRLKYYTVSGERSVLERGSICIRCCIRDNVKLKKYKVKKIYTYIYKAFLTNCNLNYPYLRPYLTRRHMVVLKTPDTFLGYKIVKMSADHDRFAILKH